MSEEGWLKWNDVHYYFYNKFMTAMRQRRMKTIVWQNPLLRDIAVGVASVDFVVSKKRLFGVNLEI